MILKGGNNQNQIDVCPKLYAVLKSTAKLLSNWVPETPREISSFAFKSWVVEKSQPSMWSCSLCKGSHWVQEILVQPKVFFHPSVRYMPDFYGWVMRTMTSFSPVDNRNGTLFITWKGLCLLIWGLKLTIPPASPTAYLTLSCGTKNEEGENHVQLMAHGFVWGNLCSRRNLYPLCKHTNSWLNYILLNAAWLNGTITRLIHNNFWWANRCEN